MAQANTNTSRISWYSPLNGKMIKEVQPHPAQSLFVEKVRITTAELLTLFSVGKLLIPAPGPGYSISIVRATVKYVSDGIAFTNTDVDDCIITYDRVLDPGIYINDTRSGVNDVKSITYTTAISSGGDTDAARSNKGVYLVRSASDLTNEGNTTSYMDFYITYYVLN